MKPIRLALLCLALYVPAVHAEPDAGAAAARLAKALAGVYKHRFTSATITPGKAPGEADVPYQAEDVIEIVPYDAGHVYLRVHLDFYNGHSCDISGIGRYENGAFVYHDPAAPLPDYPPCALKVGVVGDKLVLTDRATPDAISSCRAYCGARGGLDYDIGMDKRRPIHYMDRLKVSRQYGKAIEDLHMAEGGDRR